MSWLLTIAIMCQMVENKSPIAKDETVCFFPTYATQSADGTKWQFRVHGWIFEAETESLKRRALLTGLEQVFGVDEDATASEIFRSRMAPFLVDNERGKKISIQIGERQLVTGVSNENGHFETSVTLPAPEVDRLRSHGTASRLSTKGPFAQLVFEAVMPFGDTRHFKGEVILIPPTGVSVISDIDDTIKITGVGKGKKLIENTLFKPFEPVPGMAEVYRRWADDGAAFHYVTASPWQLYEPLRSFCGSKFFPAGTWDMKLFRWKDSTAFDLLKSAEHYKPAIIERILADFPKRTFVLVGDSGERDPEIYGAIARKHPRQLERILIRSVTADRADGERYKAAFADLPADRWQVFERSDQIAEIQ
ncbi:MAG: DUF2183 domain-containing protein [Pirellulales bacterium]|nr:DUF2183 domain-containing protein [Pirellulales bacterium]